MIDVTVTEEAAGDARARANVARLAAAQALTLVQASQRAGLVAYVDVLAADVQYHQALIGYLQAVGQRHQDSVALFAAFGGGWWNNPDHPTQAAAR